MIRGWPLSAHKLLYPNRRVQHGGVLLGIGGMCDHMNRGLHASRPGYAGRAQLAQELSAVTGACLLIRRSVFERMGGLDESFPGSFSDIDLCLRVRELGLKVVFTPAATLLHHESSTYGTHASAERTALEAAESSRMRLRWCKEIGNDPFHNPNLDLGWGREWDFAFPPRVLSASPANPP